MGLWNTIRSIASPNEDYLEENIPTRSDSFDIPIKENILFNESADDTDNAIRSLHKTIKMHFVIRQPTSFESEAEGIAEALLSGHSVMLNLEKVGAVQGRSFLEYLSGVVYARAGKPQRVSEKVYLFTPYNVEVVGDLSDLGSLL